MDFSGALKIKKFIFYFFPLFWGFSKRVESSVFLRAFWSKMGQNRPILVKNGSNCLCCRVFGFGQKPDYLVKNRSLSQNFDFRTFRKSKRCYGSNIFGNVRSVTSFLTKNRWFLGKRRPVGVCTLFRGHFRSYPVQHGMESKLGLF